MKYQFALVCLLSCSIIGSGSFAMGAKRSPNRSGSVTTPITDSTYLLTQSVPIETTLAVPGIPLTQDVWLDMISKVKTSLDLEQYYINNKAGESLEPIVNAIKAAAGRGVQVRFLLDKNFFSSNSSEANDLLNIPNLQLKTVDFSQYGGIQHAKFFVVDQTSAYVGSANFDWLALTHIHEVGMKTDDPAISTNLETLFSKDWANGVVISGSGSGTDIVKVGTQYVPSATVKLVTSPAVANPSAFPDTLDSVVKLMSSAKTTIQVQVYEFDTAESSNVRARWLVLDTELQKAAARGVKVQLMVDAVSMKSGKTDLTTLAKVPNIQVRTVLIPEWSGGPLAYARLIHSKYLVVDGATAWVGSENWIENYFTGTRNAGLMIPISSLSAQLTQIFNQVWTSAYTTKL